jgi:hypothetical protein
LSSDTVEHLIEHSDKGCEVRRWHITKQRSCRFPSFGIHARGSLRPPFGQADKRCAAIGRVWAARHPTLGLEDVNQSGDMTRRATKGLTEFTLNHCPPLMQHKDHLGARCAQTTLIECALHHVTESCGELEDTVERRYMLRQVSHSTPLRYAVFFDVAFSL